MRKLKPWYCFDRYDFEYYKQMKQVKRVYVPVLVKHKFHRMLKEVSAHA